MAPASRVADITKSRKSGRRVRWQTHLEFIPERHTDFIFAVFSEEFGLIGNLILLSLYALLIARGLMIAANAATFFARLLAATITLTFFTYAFVNMGMVSGILPVVGVPLPFVSYGGTALLTLFAGVGILMTRVITIFQSLAGNTRLQYGISRDRPPTA